MTGAGKRLVFDAMCFSHFARAERLDVLRDLVVDDECLTTRAVMEEMRQGASMHPALHDALLLDWVSVIELDTLDEIRCFVAWASRVGANVRNIGEASVLAAAELRAGIAVTDDREAVRVGRAHGLRVHGTIWLLAGACRDGKLTEVAAESLVIRFGSPGCGCRVPDRSSRDTPADTGCSRTDSKKPGQRSAARVVQLGCFGYEALVAVE